jgi:transaldolase
MKIFLDTANLDEIRQGAALGVIDGVTTNPSLVAKEKRPFREHVLEICRIFVEHKIPAAVSAEVVSTDTEGMLREGRELATWHKSIVVKCPTTPDGIRACNILTREGIRVNMTLVFSATQALLVAKAGAHFVSPFVGRLDDIAHDGLALVRQIVEIYRNYNFGTEVLAASLRGPLHVVEAARIGAHIGTMPFKVFEQLFKHPLTDRGLEAFLKDWEKAKESLGDILIPAKAGR